MVKATTVPSLVCQNTGVAVISGAVASGQAVRAQTSLFQLTGALDAPVPGRPDHRPVTRWYQRR